MPGLAMACLAVPCLALPCHALPCLALKWDLPGLAWPCIALPTRARPLHCPRIAMACFALHCCATLFPAPHRLPSPRIGSHSSHRRALMGFTLACLPMFCPTLPCLVWPLSSLVAACLPLLCLARHWEPGRLSHCFAKLTRPALCLVMPCIALPCPTSPRLARFFLP